MCAVLTIHRLSKECIVWVEDLLGETVKPFPTNTCTLKKETECVRTRGRAMGHGWGGDEGGGGLWDMDGEGTRVGEGLWDMGGEGTRVGEELRDMGGEGTRVVEGLRDMGGVGRG